MAHHSESSFFGADDENTKFGATHRFPDGKLCDHDEGEIQYGVAADPKRQIVLIDFGKPVRSIGFTPEQASDLAEALTRKAWECRGIK